MAIDTGPRTPVVRTRSATAFGPRDAQSLVFTGCCGRARAVLGGFRTGDLGVSQATAFSGLGPPRWDRYALAQRGADWGCIGRREY